MLLQCNSIDIILSYSVVWLEHGWSMVGGFGFRLSVSNALLSESFSRGKGNSTYDPKPITNNQINCNLRKSEATVQPYNLKTEEVEPAKLH